MQTMTATEVLCLTEASLLVPRLSGTHHESIIGELAGRLERAGKIGSGNAFIESVMAHDELASAVFDEVAYSLGRSETAKELAFAVGLTTQPVHWPIRSAPIIRMVVVIAVPPHEEKRCLSLLPAFSYLFQGKPVVAALQTADSPEAMFTQLRQVLSEGRYQHGFH